MVSGWSRDLARFLLPDGCVACGAWLPRRESAPLTCRLCRSRRRAPPWPRCPRCHHPRGTGRAATDTCPACADWPEALTRARAAWLLAPPVDALVHGLKYEGWRLLAREMGGDLAAAIAALEPDVVVPVPTTPERLRTRGYNQAALLAAEVAGRLDKPCADALERTRGGPTQVSLPPSERRANVRGAFAARPTELPRIRGRRVCLVDDVLTTGSTACAAAVPLVRAGARDVTLVTFARAVAPGAATAA